MGCSGPGFHPAPVRQKKEDFCKFEGRLITQQLPGQLLKETLYKKKSTNKQIAPQHRIKVILFPKEKFPLEMLRPPENTERQFRNVYKIFKSISSTST